MSRTAATILCVALVLGAAGCFNPFDPRLAPTGGIPQPPPEPNSPTGILRLYEWCWDKRDPYLYRELFTDDYQFVFARADSAGNAYRDRALTREDELEIAENIFVRGSATEPPPVSISLDWTAALLPRPDSRPGKDARVHREIAAQTLLRINTPDIEVTGTTRFFVVRGDSAKLPDELVQRGFKQDSTRWYIERIEDETLEGGTSALSITDSLERADTSRSQANTNRLSFGQMLALYDTQRRLDGAITPTAEPTTTTYKASATGPIPARRLKDQR